MKTDPITYSSTIYSTPEEWGPVTEYGDAEYIANVMTNLIANNDSDWARISLDDCTKYNLVETIGEAAIYRQARRRDDYYITARMDGDMDLIIEEFASYLEEARESLS